MRDRIDREPRPSLVAIKAALLRHQKPRRPGVGQDAHKRLVEVLSRTQLQLKDDTVAVSFSQSSGTLDGLHKFLEEIESGDTLQIGMGDRSVLVVIDKRMLGRLLEIVSSTRAPHIYRDLASIVLMIPDEVVETLGISYLIFRSLFLANINVLFESSYNDTTLTVKKEDAVKAYQVIQRLLTDCSYQAVGPCRPSNRLSLPGHISLRTNHVGVVISEAC
jgi:hypothetical protein